MKKFISLFLVSTIIFLFSGCSNTSTETNENGIETKTPTTQNNHSGESSTEQTTLPETNTTTEPVVQLSSQCGYLLCTGYDGENYYELVANRIDAYPESTFEFGVIKNNTWLIPLSTDCPFIDENGRWKGLASYEDNDVSTDNFTYLDEGCFLYNNGIIYKPETGVHFNVCNTLQAYFNEQDNIYTTNYCYTNLIVNDGIALTFDEHIKLAAFNMNNGTKIPVGNIFEDYSNNPRKLFGLHDGLFFACDYDAYDMFYVGFFDISGNMIIDLSEYKDMDFYKRPYYFTDGEATITCSNDSGVRFNITFDTSGNIIKQEKAE